MAVVMPEIAWVGAATENYGRGRVAYHDGERLTVAPEALVVHIAEGSFDAIRDWFHVPPSRRPEGVGASSAHYSVAFDGRIRCHVRPEDTAYANGAVEEGATARLLRENAGINPNAWTLSIEHEGRSGDVVPAAQWAASVHLAAWLWESYVLPGGATNVPAQPGPAHILPHAAISPVSRGRCPGWSAAQLTRYWVAVRARLAAEPVDYAARYRDELRAKRDELVEERAALAARLIVVDVRLADVEAKLAVLPV